MALNEHDERARTSLEALDAEIEEQLLEFDNITQGPLPSQYIKFSSALLNLRETEKFLVKSRRFEEAASIKAEADAKEEIEIQQLHKRFITKRMQQRQKLIECFSTKKRCIEEKNERIRNKIEQDHRSELAALKKSVDNQQKKLDVFDGVKLEARTKQKEPEFEQITPVRQLTQRTFVTNKGLTPHLATKNASSRVATIRPKTSRLAKLNTIRK